MCFPILCYDNKVNHRISNQSSFSEILFDTLFGLILFFNFDSILDISNPTTLVLYIFSIFITLHWWLLFKSSDDLLSVEVKNSVLDMLFGISEIISLFLLIMFCKQGNYQLVVVTLIALFMIDVIWAAIWRFIGKWKSTDKKTIHIMELEIMKVLLLNIIYACIFFLLLFFFTEISVISVSVFILCYISYIITTFTWSIIDLRIF